MKISTRKSTLIIGPRRCGKTTFLKNTFPDYHYATLDDFDAYEFARRDPKGFVASLGPRGIIDEIQRLPHLTVAVKYAIDNEGALFIMTGSSSIGLLDASADTMAGRIEIRSMPTVCWGEEQGEPDHDFFTDELPLPRIREAYRELDERIAYDGFPEVVAAQDAEEKKGILRNYRDTYFLRDLMQMANIENLDGLAALFANIGRALGTHLETSNLAREAGLSVPTAKKYLNTLFLSELLFRLHGYQFGPAKRFVKAAKTYFADTGIITGMGLRPSEGQLLENFVLAEFEKRRKLGMLPAERLFYYKSASGREIDLVFEIGETLYAVEIKTTRAPDRRDTANLREFIAGIKRPAIGYLLHRGEEYGELNGIRLVPIAALHRAR